jgi:hypothetical protein
MKFIICKILLRFDIDIYSIFYSLVICGFFYFETAKSYLAGLSAIAIFNLIISILVTIIFWPFDLDIRKDQFICFNQGEYIILKIRAYFKSNRGYLVITNSRIIFVGIDNIRINILLKDILYIKSRSRLLGMERWLMVVTRQSVMVFGVNNPICLHNYIKQIIDNNR